MRFSGRLAAGALAALVVGMLVAVGAVAAKRAFETNALIFFTNPNTFNGDVTSPQDKCLQKRKVAVKRVRSGPDKQVATDETNGAGFYVAVASTTAQGGDRYYAKVAKRKISAGTCASGRSGTTTIGMR